MNAKKYYSHYRTYIEIATNKSQITYVQSCINNDRIYLRNSRGNGKHDKLDELFKLDMLAINKLTTLESKGGD